MAAVWAVLILMMLDTWRLTPARTPVAAGSTPATAPLLPSDLQSLLVSLNSLHSIPPSH